MTLDDLELLRVRIFSEFRDFSDERPYQYNNTINVFQLPNVANWMYFFERSIDFIDIAERSSTRAL